MTKKEALISSQAGLSGETAFSVFSAPRAAVPYISSDQRTSRTPKRYGLYGKFLHEAPTISTDILLLCPRSRRHVTHSRARAQIRVISPARFSRQ